VNLLLASRTWWILCTSFEQFEDLLIPSSQMNFSSDLVMSLIRKSNLSAAGQILQFAILELKHLYSCDLRPRILMDLFGCSFGH
jgi:hypothetical protein